MIVVGFWICESQTHICFNAFLETFTELMKGLVIQGVKSNHENKGNVKFFPLVAISDSLARAKLLNMINHSGFLACLWCEHPGNHLNGAVRYLYSMHCAKRTDQCVRQNSISSVIGMKGPSPIRNLPHFDLVNCIPVDYMHCILLGVVKKLLDMWLGSAEKPWYIGAPRKSKKFFCIAK